MGSLVRYQRAAFFCVLGLFGAALSGCAGIASSSPIGRHIAAPSGGGGTSATTPPSTSTSTPLPTSSSTSTTLPQAPGTTAPPAPGFIADRVTAIGDSVLLDYASALEEDLPGFSVDVQAAVGRQFSTGISLAQSLHAAHELGAVVIVALGTNGTVTSQELAQMQAALSGASLVVFVTVHVDQPWQAEVNATLRSGVATMPHAVIADWATLASAHPSWLYSDGTHLPIGGSGAKALAKLVAKAVRTASSD